MFVISLFLENLLNYQAVQYAFMGIKVGVVFLLLKVSYTLIKGVKKDWFGVTYSNNRNGFNNYIRG